jgi:hypothetical protein
MQSNCEKEREISAPNCVYCATLVRLNQKALHLAKFSAAELGQVLL